MVALERKVGDGHSVVVAILHLLDSFFLSDGHSVRVLDGYCRFRWLMVRLLK